VERSDSRLLLEEHKQKFAQLIYFWLLLVENHTSLHTLRIEVMVPIRRS